MSSPSPLTLEPVLLPKVWGGDRLAGRGLAVPAQARVGEAWMVADLAATSPSGAGGQAVVNRVHGGPHAGASLRDLAARWGAGLLGRAPGHEVPVLVKLLDAREHLSVQVHPSPAYASAHPAAHLKTECWYVLAAEPGAELFLGVREGVTRDDLRAAAAAGTIPSLLCRVPAQPGHCYLLPSGMIHALGAGVLVAEVQTPSDTTYRLYDWTTEYSRAPRAMHLDESLAACDLSAQPVVRHRPAGLPRAVVAETAFFVVEEVRLEAGLAAPIGERDDAAVAVLMLEATAELRDARGAAAPIACRPDAAVLVPAACVPGTCLVSAGAATALVVRAAG